MRTEEDKTKRDEAIHQERTVIKTRKRMENKIEHTRTYRETERNIERKGDKKGEEQRQIERHKGDIVANMGLHGLLLGCMNDYLSLSNTLGLKAKRGFICFIQHTYCVLDATHCLSSPNPSIPAPRRI